MSRELNNAATSLAYQMREQIRELQEKRAAAMMNEITELQRERDVALNKVKQMDKAVSDLHKENELLKKNCDNEAELKLENKHLKQSLLEETLISSNLRKKLKNMERKPIQESSPLFQHTKAIIRLTNEESNLKTKSQSISDLTNTRYS
jgi:regulator of replication initiation timing